MKYEWLVDRPIRYIQNELGHAGWQPWLGTPPHPYRSLMKRLKILATQ